MYFCLTMPNYQMSIYLSSYCLLFFNLFTSSRIPCGILIYSLHLIRGTDHVFEAIYR
uniref:Uncharacterized protein n=1 Tax=Lepeophtheirus salmonis TaxID=72036 RepID=A0A0K2SV52_LEPSM